MRAFEGEFEGQRVVYGAASAARVPEEVARLGGRRPVVLSTRGRRDVADHVAGALPGCVGVADHAVMHTPVEVTEHVLGLPEIGRADALVSVGGGSTTGLGKALAVRTGLPHLVLPTTYAGSEVTPVLGETSDGEKSTRTDPRIRPQSVVYDVELTTSLPAAYTLTSAVNAMAHGAEALYGDRRTAETDALATGAVAALAGGLRSLSADADDLGARDDLLYGAWLAGRCLALVGMGLHHKICHVLGGTFDLPHAATHTVVLPHVLGYNAGAAPEAVSAVAAALQVDDAAAGLHELVGQLDGPTSLATLGFDAGDVERAADLVVSNTYANPRTTTRESVAALLRRAVDGSAP